MDFVDSLKSSDIQTAAAGRENTFCSYLTHHLCKLVFIVFLGVFFHVKMDTSFLVIMFNLHQIMTIWRLFLEFYSSVQTLFKGKNSLRGRE